MPAEKIEDEGGPHPVDRHVGSRIRLRRIQRGVTQSALASRVGISFQAVQKYETGHIRVSASRLYEIAESLEVSLDFLFEGYPGAERATRGREEAAPVGADFLDAPAIRRLIRGFYAIHDDGLRSVVLTLVLQLGRRPEE